MRSAGAASRRRGHTSLEDKNLISEDGSPEDAAIQAGARRRLDILVAQLPEEFREVLPAAFEEFALLKDPGAHFRPAWLLFHGLPLRRLTGSTSNRRAYRALS